MKTIRAYWSKRRVETNGSFQNLPNSFRDYHYIVLPQTFLYNIFWSSLCRLTVHVISSSQIQQLNWFISWNICALKEVHTLLVIRKCFKSLQVLLFCQHQAKCKWRYYTEVVAQCKTIQVRASNGFTKNKTAIRKCVYCLFLLALSKPPNVFNTRCAFGNIVKGWSLLSQISNCILIHQNNNFFKNMNLRQDFVEFCPDSTFRLRYTFVVCNTRKMGLANILLYLSAISVT